MKTPTKIALLMSALLVQAAHADLVTIEFTGHAIQTAFDPLVVDGYGLDPYGANIIGQAYDATFTFDTADGVTAQSSTAGSAFNRFYTPGLLNNVTAKISIGGHDYVQSYESFIDYYRYQSAVDVTFNSFPAADGSGQPELHFHGNSTTAAGQTIDMNLLTALSLSSSAPDISSWGSGYGQLSWSQDLLSVTLSVESVSVQAVPVPATAWLLGSGLIGLIGITRRK